MRYIFSILLICILTSCAGGGQQRSYIISQSQAEEAEMDPQK
jgi:hypothetical protein